MSSARQERLLAARQKVSHAQVALHELFALDSTVGVHMGDPAHPRHHEVIHARNMLHKATQAVKRADFMTTQSDTHKGTADSAKHRHVDNAEQPLDSRSRAPQLSRLAIRGMRI